MSEQQTSKEAFFWVLQGICALHRRPFSLELAQQQLAAPYSPASLLEGLAALGFAAANCRLKPEKFRTQTFPLVVWLSSPSLSPLEDKPVFGECPAMVLQADDVSVLIVEAEDAAPRTVSIAEFKRRYSGKVTRVSPAVAPDDASGSEDDRQSRKFGFGWFMPELGKHKKLWQEILMASLVIQLIALATPLFTQAILDKVIVHHTQSTLIVIAIGMFVFILFSACLSWLRQYLVLHTGNRVDAVLGSAVFGRLFKLPPLYFQHRPTGVIAARMHGIETIREFIASSAVTLVLDLPFLFIFLAIMFYYSVMLTLVALAILSVIVVLSMVVAPLPPAPSRAVCFWCP
jgi:subfamily B ATP-binding cassette protein HlyB/CyaB